MNRFSFWGLFAVFGAMLVAYWWWMRREERREARSEARSEDRSEDGDTAKPPADGPEPAE